MSFYDRLIDLLKSDYQKTAARADVRALLSPALICPNVIGLPLEIADQAKAIVTAFFELRQSSVYQDFARERNLVEQRPAPFDPGNYSALMCFDFHLIDEKKLKLIEINTNASMSLIGDLVYRTHGLDNGFSKLFRKEIAKTFEQEMRLGGDLPGILTIVDDKPEAQRLYIEFLLYAELFDKCGVLSSIADPSALTFSRGKLLHNGDEVALVYNRHTDFYLEKPETVVLAQAFQSRASTVSPNPHEYMLLADKERMRDLTDFIDEDGTALSRRFSIAKASAAKIGECILKTKDVQSSDPAELWNDRKHYFFKPKRSFGGKAVYKGASISRTMFESQILKGEYIAQEFAPPPHIVLPVSEDQVGGDFKFDLRFYVYKDQIQLAVARLYQGQTTNFQNPGGGIAAIRWLK